MAPYSNTHSTAAPLKWGVCFDIKVNFTVKAIVSYTLTIHGLTLSRNVEHIPTENAKMQHIIALHTLHT